MQFPILKQNRVRKTCSLHQEVKTDWIVTIVKTFGFDTNTRSFWV